MKKAVLPVNEYDISSICYLYNMMASISFLSDWWEAALISTSYGMGDPLAPSESEGEQWRGEVSPVRNLLK